MPAGELPRLRPYQPRDNAGVYDVCLRTGDAGRDAAHLFDDPLALGHIYVGPYMRLEPDLAFVLEDDQGVCGYVLGALDSKKFYDKFVTEWLPEIRRHYPEPLGDPAAWTRSQKIYYEYYHPDLYCPEPYDKYPSHLHIDLLPRAQGKGHGRRMMETLLSALRATGTLGTHLGMAATNARAERFYKKLGFHELVRVGESLYLGKSLD